MNKNLHQEIGFVTREERESTNHYRAITFWFTGLSGAGKSTIAKHVERGLFDAGVPVSRLDGDNLRSGLNKDLGFSLEDRSENIRRAAEAAHLFNSAGVSVICSLISPLAKDRENARAIIGTERFFEIYVRTSLQECERRDPHGLYEKARSGEIRDFTGISSPYEPPVSPWLAIDTEHEDSQKLASIIVSRYMDFGRIIG